MVIGCLYITYVCYLYLHPRLLFQGNEWAQTWDPVNHVSLWVTSNTRSPPTPGMYWGKFLEMYRWFINDHMGISEMFSDKHRQSVNFFSSFNPTITFASQVSTTPMHFFNIKVSIHIPALTTTADYKPTNSHSYLLYNFCYCFLLLSSRLLDTPDKPIDASSPLANVTRWSC